MLQTPDTQMQDTDALLASFSEDQTICNFESTLLLSRRAPIARSVTQTDLIYHLVTCHWLSTAHVMQNVVICATNLSSGVLDV